MSDYTQQKTYFDSYKEGFLKSIELSIKFRKEVDLEERRKLLSEITWSDCSDYSEDELETVFEETRQGYSTNKRVLEWDSKSRRLEVSLGWGWPVMRLYIDEYDNVKLEYCRAGFVWKILFTEEQEDFIISVYDY